MMSKRKERLSTKRIILKGKFIVSTEEIQNRLAEAERITKEKKRKRGCGKNKRPIKEMEMLEDDTSDGSDVEKCEIFDCIDVKLAQ